MSKRDDLKAWFREDVSRWEALSDAGKRRLAKCSPFYIEPSKPLRQPLGKGGARDGAGRPRDTRNPRDPRTDKLLLLADGTQTIDDVAQIIPLSKAALFNMVIRLRAEGHNPTFKRKGSDKNASRDQEILESQEAHAVIGRRLGISAQRVQQIRERLGWKRHRKRE